MRRRDAHSRICISSRQPGGKRDGDEEVTEEKEEKEQEEKDGEEEEEEEKEGAFEPRINPIALTYFQPLRNRGDCNAVRLVPGCGASLTNGLPDPGQTPPSVAFTRGLEDGARRKGERKIRWAIRSLIGTTRNRAHHLPRYSILAAARKRRKSSGAIQTPEDRSVRTVEEGCR